MLKYPTKLIEIRWIGVVNNMLYCLLGKTCSGKTTILDHLRDLGFNIIISYTTRPQREHEVDGKDYYFVTEEQFEEMEDKLVAKNTFISAFGDKWHYGKHITEDDLKKDSFTIVEPSGYRELKKLFGKENVVGIYLDVPLKIRIVRGLNRGDRLSELVRRLEADEQDFQGLEKEVGYILRSLDKEEIIAQILEIVEKRRGKRNEEAISRIPVTSISK
jgi:guanylate kinase